MKKQLFCAVTFSAISIVLYMLHSVQPLVSIIRYLTLTSAFVIMGYCIASRLHHKQQSILYWLGVAWLLCYVIVCLDTFLFHSRLFFPGIIRYPLFSLYGLPYIIFMIPGILLSFHKKAG